MQKIVITGPESTGKSTLCRQLAIHYGCDWVPEYAREYLEKNGPEYEFETLKEIARGQLAVEEEYVAKSRAEGSDKPFLFIDTCMWVMKVWSEYVFNDCDPYILDQIAKRGYDAYLLCDIDLPWQYDELREHPHERDKIFRYYADALQNQPVPWKVIRGLESDRLRSAIEFVDTLLKTANS